MMHLALFLISFFSLSSHAQIFKGPQSAAMGGTGVAGLGSAEATFLNPALIALIPGYEAVAYFRDGQKDVGQHRHAWGATLLDNGTDVALAGTLSYLRLRETGVAAEPVNGELWHVSLGQDFQDQWAVGVSGTYLTQNIGVQAFKQWNYSLGVVWMPVTGWVLGYVLSDLALPGGDVPLSLRQDLTQTVGTNFQWTEIMRLRVDVSRRERLNPDKKLSYAMGLESLTSEFFLMRLGYRHDEWADQRFWTAGIGFNGPRLRVDYAFEKNQERAGGAVHSVDMLLPF